MVEGRIGGIMSVGHDEVYLIILVNGLANGLAQLHVPWELTALEYQIERPTLIRRMLTFFGWKKRAVISLPIQGQEIVIRERGRSASLDLLGIVGK